jgi:hypothetical protein
MKNPGLLLFFIAFAASFQLIAQSTPVVDQRQQVQRHRVRQGVATGELTRGEAASSRHDQRKVRRTERRAKADGIVTDGEKARIHHKQNKASRKLRRNKRDAQSRPEAN